MSQNPVTVSFDGGVAVITVNNPPVNTINAVVRDGLNAAIDTIEAQGGVAAVTLTCEGSTFFSGADIAEFSGPPQEEKYRDLFRRLEGLTVPVVAGMHGVIMGGGLEIALACHYRVAAPGTRFGLPEVTLGIIPGAGGTQRMPRLIGVEKTLEHDSRRTAGRRRRGAVARIPRRRGATGEIRAATIAYAKELVEDTARARAARRSAASIPATATPAIIERLTAQAKSQYPNREAALTAIKAVTAAVRLPLEEGLTVRDRTRQRRQGDRRVEGAGPRVLRRARDAQGPRSAGRRQGARRRERRGRRRGHDGWRHRDLLRQRGIAGDGARFEPGGARQRLRRHRQDLRFDGQARPADAGREGPAARADPRHAELRGSRRRRRHHRGGVRESRAETADLQVARRGRESRAPCSRRTPRRSTSARSRRRRGGPRTSSACTSSRPRT